MSLILTRTLKSLLKTVAASFQVLHNLFRQICAYSVHISYIGDIPYALLYNIILILISITIIVIISLSIFFHVHTNVTIFHTTHTNNNWFACLKIFQPCSIINVFYCFRQGYK